MAGILGTIEVEGRMGIEKRRTQDKTLRNAIISEQGVEEKPCKEARKGRRRTRWVQFHRWREKCVSRRLLMTLVRAFSGVTGLKTDCSGLRK